MTGGKPMTMGVALGLVTLVGAAWHDGSPAVREAGDDGLIVGHAASLARHAPPWGSVGHEMAARAAVTRMPSGMPAFFREAGDRLVYLNPEPDRWRVGRQREMDQAFQYDHYIDLENVPDGALEARDRFDFLRRLYEAGLERPERDAGFLPFRITELYQRIVTEWRLWRAETDPERRAWIAERIVNDAGILGHYVTDGSQPHHTTIHFNGWDRDTPNPAGYTTDNGFHARFETGFVSAHVRDADLARHLGAGELRSVAGSARAAVMDHIMAAHAEVETLYRLDRDVGFDPEQPPVPEAREFAAERLAAGAEMLAVLWWSAWVESGTPLPGGRRDGGSSAAAAAALPDLPEASRP